MSLSTFIIIFLIICLIVSILLLWTEKEENKKYYNDFMLLKSQIAEKYIKRTDVRLLNAVQQAYETAKEKDKQFQMREYDILLKELKGK